MRWLRRKDRQRNAEHPKRILGWALVLGVLFGLIGAGEYPEDRLRVVRNHVNAQPVSGDIILVGIDEKSVREVGRWPWPRDRYADLVSALGAASPRRQIHDINFPERSTVGQDQALVRAAAENAPIGLPYLQRVGARDGILEEIRPFPELERHAVLASISVRYNYANEVWVLNHASQLQGRDIPGFASLLAGRDRPASGSFRVNYSFVPDSVPLVSAADVLAGRADPKLFKGKQVVVGITAERLGDQFMIPGWGKYGGVYVQIIGAETLRAGDPVDLGWIPAYLLAAALVVLIIGRNGRLQALGLGAGLLLLLTVPVLLERGQIFADITAGLFVISWV